MRGMALQCQVNSHYALLYQTSWTCLFLAARIYDLARGHKLWDTTLVAAGVIVRTVLGNTCTAAAMMEDRHYPGKKCERGWVHLNGRIVSWPAFDHKLVGRGIAMGAWDSWLRCTVFDLGTAEPGSLTEHLKCRLRIAVGLDGTCERK